MNSENKPFKTPALYEQTLVELQRLWLREKWDLQVLLNQIEDAISQQQTFHISITGTKGSGKSHLLHLLIKHLADSYLPKNTNQNQLTSAPLKLVFIVQNAAQINSFEDLLNAIAQQCCDHPEQSSKQATEQQQKQIIEQQLNHTPIIVFIDNFEQILAAIEPSKISSLQALFGQPQTSQNPLSLIVAQSQISDILPYTKVELSDLTQKQTQQLIELRLPRENLQAANQAQLKLANKILYRLFSSNGHYYQQFIDAIGAPSLNQLNQQLSYFIKQQTTLNNAMLATKAPLQRQIISLLSKRVMQQSGSMPVGDIANALHLTHQTTSSQLKKMRDNHWVSSTKIGRSSFYQLADLTQSYSLALNHIHPIYSKANGIDLSIDFAYQWLKGAALDLPSDDGQNFITDKAWLTKHSIPAMLPLVIRLKHHIDSFITALNQQQPEANSLLESLNEKLSALSDNIINSPFAEQQNLSAQSHIELFNGLIIRALICAIKDPDNQAAIHAVQMLSEQIFDFANQLNQIDTWKHLGQLWISTSALMAHCNLNENLSQYIHELEKQENKLHSLDNSINIAHCLVYKCWGYCVDDNKQQLQQTLEQLRIRADKRNSPQLTGAYCHAIKLNISYIAKTDLKLAQRLVKQMLELSHRYPIVDLYFACLWRISVFEQQQNSFDTLIKLIEKVHQSNIFNAELCLWLRHIHQPHQLQAIKRKLNELNQLGTFSAALIKTACYILTEEPQSFIHRLKQWQQAIQGVNQEDEENSKAILQHTQNLIGVLNDYHQQTNELQLLKLPVLERQLIREEVV